MIKNEPTVRMYSRCTGIIKSCTKESQLEMAWKYAQRAHAINLVDFRMADKLYDHIIQQRCDIYEKAKSSVSR